MPRFRLPVIQSYKAPDSDREVQLRLHNHVYVFTTTASTQTDSEVFFVNGKPARAVQPFRVVPKKPKAMVAQMAGLDLAIAGTSREYRETIVDGIHLVESWPSPQQMQEIAAQLPEQTEQPEQQQPEQQQLELQQPEQQQPEQQPVASGSGFIFLYSQETQTDMELFFEDEESASEGSFE